MGKGGAGDMLNKIHTKCIFVIDDVYGLAKEWSLGCLFPVPRLVLATGGDPRGTPANMPQM